jgi:hypothetical protein
VRQKCYIVSQCVISISYPNRHIYTFFCVLEFFWCHSVRLCHTVTHLLGVNHTFGMCHTCFKYHCQMALVIKWRQYNKNSISIKSVEGWVGWDGQKVIPRFSAATRLCIQPNAKNRKYSKAFLNIQLRLWEVKFVFKTFNDLFGHFNPCMLYTPLYLVATVFKLFSSCYQMQLCRIWSRNAENSSVVSCSLFYSCFYTAVFRPGFSLPIFPTLLAWVSTLLWKS